MPGPPCTVCVHEQRHEIDRLIALGGGAVRAISGRYGLSPSALDRHKDHVARALRISALIDQRAAEMDLAQYVRRAIAQQDLAQDAVREHLARQDCGGFAYDPEALDQLTKHSEAQRRHIETYIHVHDRQSLEVSRENMPDLADAREIVISIVAQRVKPQMPAIITRCLERAGLANGTAKRVGKVLGDDLLGEIVAALLEEDTGVRERLAALTAGEGEPEG